AFDTLASDHEAQGFEAFDLTSRIPLLTTGANLLAVEVHNRDLMSSDLSFHPNLQANVPVTGGPLPPGFVTDTLAGGFSSPVALAFADDGRMFVAEKRGTVWIVKNGSTLPTPFLTLDDEINNAGDRGLLGIALHPDFALNGYVYVLFVVDPIPGAPDEPA